MKLKIEKNVELKHWMETWWSKRRTYIQILGNITNGKQHQGTSVNRFSQVLASSALGNVKLEC